MPLTKGFSATAALLCAGAVGACASGVSSTPRLPTLPFAADTVREQVLQRGATRRFIYARSGPWAIHLLDIDLRCYRPAAVKGARGAAGREKTSNLMQRLTATSRVIGGVNADFFLFTPPGVPRGAHIEDGRVITGPARDPALTIDSVGVPRIEVLTVQGTAVVRGQRFRITSWNRVVNNGLAFIDAAWGSQMDTATTTVEVTVSGGGGQPRRVVGVDTTVAGVAIPAEGAVLIAGRLAPDSIRSALLALRVGDTVPMSISLAPRHPRDAVGGRPVLVRDSMIVSDVDSVGGAAFATARHPRTAVGIVGSSRRAVLVVVDGRQAPYSDGMTLRELATLMLALGAKDAINLDGGGSTTLVYADPMSHNIRVSNKPSDQQGERAVGNALAVIQFCQP